ncbi:hypothetical protein X875_12200 [Mannheimia varigena USDA-ARS-USMARC-1388]|nr:hypothetical protein X875_12200 [Mannheimia varigena USDA-ARS-USMARC-1388]
MLHISYIQLCLALFSKFSSIIAYFDKTVQNISFSVFNKPIFG